MANHKSIFAGRSHGHIRAFLLATSGQITWPLVGRSSWPLTFVCVIRGTSEHAATLKVDISEVLAPLGLEFSEEKTGIVTIDEGFDFLGFTKQRRRKRGTNKSYVYTVPSQKSIKLGQSKIAQTCYRATRHRDCSELLKRFNQILAGWANYCRHGVSKHVSGSIDHYAGATRLEMVEEETRTHEDTGHET